MVLDRFIVDAELFRLFADTSGLPSERMQVGVRASFI